MNDQMNFLEYQNQQNFNINKKYRPLTSKPPLKLVNIALGRDGRNFINNKKEKLLPPIESIQLQLNSRLASASRCSSNERNKENINFQNRPLLPVKSDSISNLINKKRSSSNYISNNKGNTSTQSTASSSSSIQNGSISTKNINNLQPNANQKSPYLFKQGSSCSIQRQTNTLNTEQSSSQCSLNSFEDYINKPRKSTVSQNQINNKCKEQKPLSAQFSKKPRVLSVKRSQNPDITLLENAHPLIETSSCLPILKKQITAFPPQVTAKAWALFDGSSGKFIDGKCVHNQREVASLTKIMTCYTVIEFFEQILQKDMKRVFVRVSSRASQTNGTSARLKYNMIISIWDLLYGLMLPSGNDSAVCLAENVGSLMYLYYVKQDNEILQDEFIYDEQLLHKKLELDSTPNTGMQRFLVQMNINAVNFELINTNYSNPHGLKNPLNKSSAYDVAKISCNAMKLESFKKIVTTKIHTAQVKVKNQQGLYENVSWTWENTNKLLDKGWSGIKTGITDAAGPCLASCIKFKDPINEINRYLIIVILSAQSMDIRWSECQKIAAWAVENYDLEI
ncbi:D-alanyl-D-alanine carboxypeptidase family protein (macronuclear) [Tetrahymena thermophila SB210]|uniref:D-alanyl-D-alanine carboxypeptidase family protein n=1 Tax=Tetrahymena thermophila (strain SB210) TaxID=312017 RepID=I7LX10_TETTS|nr:D-alanyl-D-alanine carboxypeptidase family protein [Tetrahymena thermophila SB210]EAS03230.2 D-alanyl-D-alanine carboxypeptidase family protein [Tetrahymena thermophila SB210]|eukprot:XP_001023475.2 D-alanyl-D-alanine carboxypeptidase family protein [Tetrahymena thermophila SB210]